MDEKTSNYLQKAKDKYGDFYNYDEVVYVNARTKITIICPKHGKYEQLPLNHLRQNCPKCAIEKESQRKSNSFNEFKKHLTPYHLAKYNYSKMQTYSFNSMETFVCPIHGDFKQKVKNHIASKGCYLCGRDSYVANKSLTLGENLNSINLPKNISVLTPLSIKVFGESAISLNCLFHGNYTQKLTQIRRSCTCPTCSKTGFSRRKFVKMCERKNRDKVIFYKINIFNSEENFMKIGITSIGIKYRFKNLFRYGYKYKIIDVIKGTPLKIWNLENNYKKSIPKENRYIPKVLFPGYTECFKN